jgi:hypothetical protein
VTDRATSQRARAQRLADLYAWLSRAAENGDPCPMNFEIGARFGLGLNQSALMIQKLEAEGSIHVERFHQCRRVTILATGRSTAIPDGVMRRHWSERRVVPVRPKPAPPGPRVVGMPGGFRGELPASRYVDRNPCERCGTRRDYGCKHHPLAGAAA